MATVRTINVGSMAPGLNNRLQPTQLDKRMPDGSKATYLYGADNVDLNEMGYLKRRKGKKLVLTGNAHSLWADRHDAFVVVDTVLQRLAFNNDLPVMSVIRSNLPRLPLSYSRGADNDVYWSNGQVIRRITNGTDAPIITPTPNAVPLAAVGSGAMAAGKYLIAFTASGPDGESPATPPVQIEVPDNGGIDCSMTEPVNIYMSGPNGDILTLQMMADAPITLIAHNEGGRRCMTLNRASMPAGQIVRHYAGCMWVASGNLLFVSDPYNYGVYEPGKSYYPFPAPITIIEPMENGVYLVADQTYWISDGIDTDKLRVLLPYGAVAGTSGRSPNDMSVFWQSERGLVVGDKDSVVKNLQEDALELSPASAGASLYRERDGMHHVVSTRFGAEPSVAAATSYMEAEIVRKGTEL